MDSVLQTPELLRLIFEHCNDPANLSNAIVCRLWSEICLDVMWNEVVSGPRLFRLFGPVRATRLGAGRSSISVEPAYSLVSGLSRANWRRFQSVYSHRIRAVSISYKSTKDFSSVITHVARFRPAEQLFSRLESLEIDGLNGTRSAAWMFMHQGIKRLVLKDRALSAPNDLAQYFEDVQARMPHLTSLDLNVSAGQEIAEKIAGALSFLPMLESVTLPPFEDIANVLKVASTLPRLRSLRVGHGTHVHSPTRPPTRNLAIGDSDNAFPALETLAVTTTCSSIINLFIHRGSCRSLLSLTHITLDSYPMIADSPSQIQDALHAIAESCKNITSLTMHCLHHRTLDSDMFDDIPSSPHDIVHFKHIKPILKCSKMTSFRLMYLYSCSFEQKDIERIALAWPGIKCLELNYHPFIPLDFPENKHLTLRSMIPFSIHCPSLVQLRLPISKLMDTPKLDECLRLKPFQCLECLTLGLANIDGDAEEEDIAIFLMYILPKYCQIEWMGLSESGDRKWTKIKESLPSLRRMRDAQEAVGRARLKELEDENARLRNQLNSL